MKAEEFEKLKNVDVRTVDIHTLEDIDRVKVDKSLPKEERMLDFVRKIKNPFCFICNGMVVKTSFADTGESLENILARLCLNMDGN